MNRSSTLSHGTAWTLGILAVLVLYVGTWPFIESRYSWDPPQIPQNSGGFTIDLNFTPRWVEILYAPLHWLRDREFTPNPMQRYWVWCMRRRGALLMYR